MIITITPINKMKLYFFNNRIKTTHIQYYFIKQSISPMKKMKELNAKTMNQENPKIKSPKVNYEIRKKNNSQLITKSPNHEGSLDTRLDRLWS